MRVGEILIYLGYIDQVIKLKTLIHQKNLKFGEYLIQNNFINQKQLQEALELQKKNPNELAELLLEKIQK